jgi:hypothetical protein
MASDSDSVGRACQRARRVAVVYIGKTYTSAKEIDMEILCWFCSEPIGDKPYVDNPDGGNPIHSACLNSADAMDRGAPASPSQMQYFDIPGELQDFLKTDNDYALGDREYSVSELCQIIGFPLSPGLKRASGLQIENLYAVTISVGYCTPEHRERWTRTRSQ